MFSATDSASKNVMRWISIGTGLCALLCDAGCARVQNYLQPAPMLGSADPFDQSTLPATGGDQYAEHVGKGAERSRALLARERPANSPNADGPGTSQRALAANTAPNGAPTGRTTRSLEVALQPPVALTSAPPLATSGAAVPTLATANASRPLKPKLVSAPANARKPAPNAETIVAAARARINAMKTYQVAIKRQERVGQTLMPAEEVILSMNREPMAVRLEWPNGPHKGREVIYGGTAGDGLMHVNNSDSLIPVPPLSLAVDSPMVLQFSRHPITDAGFDVIVAKMEKALKSTAANPTHGKITYGGLEDPGELGRPCHKLVRVMPSGETWSVYIDPKTKFPALVEAKSPKNELLEHYAFLTPKLDLPELASASAFDPNQRWGPPMGILQRLARANTTKPATENTTR